MRASYCIPLERKSNSNISDLSEELNSSSYSYKIIVQFSFMVDDSTLSCVLKGIASQDIGINGYLQTKPLEIEAGKNQDLNLVRLTVGNPDLETPKALRVARETFQRLGVKYQEKPVIQVLVPNIPTPGTISGLYGALWCKVNVNAIYRYESTFFIDTNDVCEALFILTEVPRQECPTKCESK